jgi:hypothetical protein
MRRLNYSFIVLLIVAAGLLFANCSSKKETPKTSNTRPLTAAEKEAEMKRWEATPEGVKYKKWEASAAGKKVLAGADKIRSHTQDSSNIEAVITSLTLPPGSRLGYGVMARINDEDYILSFGVESDNIFQQLRSLKVNDKIIIKSHSVSWAPKYAYPILSGDYVERDNKILYKRPPQKGGC